MRNTITIDPIRDKISQIDLNCSQGRSGIKPVLALASVAALVPILTGLASAADLPAKAAAAPVISWTGCYVGVNGGGASSGSDFTSAVDPGTHLVAAADLATANTFGSGSANDLGFIGGGQAGCNLQSGAYAVGIEGDWDYFGSKSTFNNPNGTLTTGDTVSITQSLKTSSLATIRPRLGIVSDRTLIYVTGGAAFARVSYTQAYTDTLNNAVGAASASTTLVGWTVGAGWEWAWTDHLSVKTEYLFAQFPTVTALGGILDNAGGTNVLHGSADLNIQTARLGLNYRF